VNMNGVSEVKPLEASDVLLWLVSRFARWLKMKPDELDTSQRISQYGLDSVAAVSLSSELEDELGIQLETAVIWEYPTLESLAGHLAGELSRQGITTLPAVDA